MHNPATAGTTPASRTLQFRVGLGSLPYLADHGFQDMVVLPGSFCLDLVRRVHRDLFPEDAVCLSQIEFEKPVIMSDEDVDITIRVNKQDTDCVTYELFEAASKDPFARLLVDPPLAAPDVPAPSFDSAAFLDHAVPLGETEALYRQFRRNGNQYGPQFQTLATAWQSGAENVARFAVPGEPSAATLLDAGVQLLGAFALASGRTFLLKSIDRLVAGASMNAVPQWVRARRTDSGVTDGHSLTGSVEFFDTDGTCLWELRGVTLSFLDPPPAQTLLRVASTFTAEPIENSLRFWGAQFGRNVRVEFAPYNQVFQQLLDPTSAFRRNDDGINIVVLDLEDWLPEKPPPLAFADADRAAKAFAGKPRAVLPNGLEIVHLNQYETDYVFAEIFQDECYLRHGIEFHDGDTVVDIGANIGLFSLFVLSRCRNAAIYAYEPSPRVYELLQANCAAYGDVARVHAFPYGVAETAGREPFTFYEHSSVFSGFHPDESEDRAAVQAVVRNVLRNELSDTDSVREEDVEDLITHRLHAQTIECQLTTVSDIIRENRLTRIHLLKIDAEKCEMGILRGITEEHWPLIDQIVIEVHDRTRASIGHFEEMLAQHGYRCAVVEEKLLAGSGLFNIYATRRTASTLPRAATDDEFSRKVDEFCTAVDAFAASTSTPSILAITPRAPGRTKASLDRAEERILAQAARHPQVRGIGSPAIIRRYPVREWHDRHSHQLGHMPFTMEGYAAIGTALSRAIFQLGCRPVKVIALDCDHTLWQGVCGEDGPQGVVVSEPFRRLQEFMLAQTQAGVLLALCSKNNESDALAVFDHHAGMLLRREHLAGWRINWEDKTENLRALAAALNLGLESFVFLDDNPLECATVRAGCPEVTVLRLPADVERIPAFLESLWIFDHSTTTREDRARSEWYRANVGREELRAAAPTLRNFLDGLELRIEVAEATEDQLERVAQLTARTNQFNFTSIRHSDAELRALLKSGAACLATCVSDRFGDYGLVGAILYRVGADGYAVENVLLSCRALGKGVEHRMLSELGRRALREGKSRIQFTCRESGRNEPALTFFKRLGPVTQADSELRLTLPAATVADLRYTPENLETASAPSRPKDQRSAAFHGNDSAALQQLGEEFTDIDSIVAAIHRSSEQTPPLETVAGRGTMEHSGSLHRSLAAIWQKALGRAHIGYDERFFDAGGTSLKAVMVVAMIRKQLKKTLSIVSLFECPTINLLAARLEDPGEDRSASADAAGSRGRQRRHKLAKRGGRLV